jgi:hypothetical protein
VDNPLSSGAVIERNQVAGVSVRIELSKLFNRGTQLERHPDVILIGEGDVPIVLQGDIAEQAKEIVSS